MKKKIPFLIPCLFNNVFIKISMTTHTLISRNIEKRFKKSQIKNWASQQNIHNVRSTNAYLYSTRLFALNIRAPTRPLNIIVNFSTLSTLKFVRHLFIP